MLPTKGRWQGGAAPSPAGGPSPAACAAESLGAGVGGRGGAPGGSQRGEGGGSEGLPYWERPLPAGPQLAGPQEPSLDTGTATSPLCALVSLCQMGWYPRQPAPGQATCPDQGTHSDLKLT